MQDPSLAVRQEILFKIADQYNTLEEGALSDAETKIVEDIFRALARSAEVDIRRTLAEGVKNSTNLPKDIALKMANDIESVSSPILQHSQVLSDSDLMDIMNSSKDAGRALAIARRDNLSEAMTTVLIDKRNDAVTGAVLNSFGSVISEDSYNKILEESALNESIINAMLEKGTLSVKITERLLKQVTGKIRDDLDDKYQVVFENKQLKKEMEKNLELAAESIMGVRAAAAHNKKMLEELHAAGQLLPLTALSTGNFTMFEVSLSRLAHVPLNNVRILIYDHGALGLERLCQKARLPEKLFGVIAIAARALQTFEAEASGKKTKVTCTPKELLDRIKLLAGNKEIDHLDFFISLMKMGGN